MDLTVLNHLPERLDDPQLALVEYIASLPVSPLVPVTENHFLKCMRMLTTLPARDGGDLKGELQLALYRRHFGELPNDAWSFLVEHATLECRFFPMPSECKAIFDRWKRNDLPWRAHRLAQLRLSQERQARMDDAMMRFRLEQVSQEQADAMPEQWRRVAMVRGYLWEATGKLRAFQK